MLKSVLARVKRTLSLNSEYRDLREQTNDPLEALCFGGTKPLLITFDLAKTRWHGPTGFAYGQDTSHPYVGTLREYQRSGNADYAGSALQRYWHDWQPKNLAEALGLGPESSVGLLRSAPSGHRILPWYETSSLRWSKLTSFDAKSRRYYQEGFSLTRTNGPHSPQVGRKRIQRIIDVFLMLNEGGFWRHPPEELPYFEQFPVGDIMERGSEAVLMIANGQHRLSALSAMGMRECTMLIGVKHQRGPFLVRRGDVDRWPLVRKGVFSRDQALEVFDRIFDGRQPAGCRWGNMS
jgi:hypothetical protein